MKTLDKISLGIIHNLDKQDIYNSLLVSSRAMFMGVCIDFILTIPRKMFLD